jgi:hypothetical protein
MKIRATKGIKMIFKSLKQMGRLTLVVAVLAFCFGPSIATAQDVANGQATATVLTVLAVTSTSDLQFGDVLQGVSKVADKTVVGEAGVFNITGSGGNEVSLYMQLPDYISLADGSDRMVVSFSDTDADIDFTDAATPAAHTAGAVVDQDPHNLPATAINAAAAPDNNIKIFLGGSVFPTVDQTAGAYSGDIILTVAYTGN